MSDDDDGTPIAVGDEITVKVDTGVLAHHDQLRVLSREVHRLAIRVARAEQLALQAIRRANAREPKN